jgi:ribosome-associated protein
MHECLKDEINFRTSRSSGPGGQHANKTESRVELSWNLEESVCLNESQKLLLRKRLASRLTDQGILVMASEKHRSQYRNREDVTVRFLSLISASLIVKKKRKPTRPTRASVEKRIKSKKIRGEIKRSRREKPGE